MYSPFELPFYFWLAAVPLYGTPLFVAQTVQLTTIIAEW